MFDVSVLCVCPVIDHEFRHNIVKVAVDPRGDSRVYPQTTWIMCILCTPRTIYRWTYRPIVRLDLLKEFLS